MKLPAPIVGFLRERLLTIPDRRPPDVLIGGTEEPYLRRWWVIPRNPVFNVYLHHFMRSDDDRALHSHPWASLSILLSGSYTEHTILAGGTNVRTVRRAGDLKARWPSSFHRIELHSGSCWTLFLTGPRVKDWYFACRDKLVHWRDFTSPDDKGKIGRGCGEN